VDSESGVEADHPSWTVRRDWGVTEHSGKDVREAKMRRTRAGEARSQMLREFSCASKIKTGTVTTGRTSAERPQGAAGAVAGCWCRAASASTNSRRAAGLVMYTLAGNYESSQVHVRDLLERLAH
ncbi:MAG: hypothetical protein ACREO5_06220, partial [Candidatus Binatia bacterium]